MTDVAASEGPTDELVVRYRRTSELRTYHRNPRVGDVPAIARSLAAHGQYKPIVVNRGTYTGRPDEVLVGNHTLMGSRELEWEWIATVERDVDEDQAARIVAADNRLADLGTYDNAALAELLHGLDDLGATGYEVSDLEAIDALLAEPEEGAADDEDDQSALDETDRAAWPVIRVQVPPHVHARWTAVPAEDDTERLTALLDAADAALEDGDDLDLGRGPLVAGDGTPGALPGED